MKIGIVVDSACDLPRGFLDEHGVRIMPVKLRVGDQTIEDRRDPKETLAFYARQMDRRDEDYSESIPYSPQQIEELFLDRLVLDYDYVFCLTVTSTRSAIHDNAIQASRRILTRYKAIRRQAGLSERFGLAVLSTRNLFTGQAVPVAEAVRLIREDSVPSEIGARLKHVIQHTHTYMVPADLYHIYKRASKKGDTSINWGTYTLGSWLDVKPILHCNRDATDTVGKVRGFEAGVQRLFDQATEEVRTGLEAPVICISYGGPLSDVSAMPGYARLADAAEAAGVQVLVAAMSKTAAVNVGPGALSIAYTANPD